MSETSLPGNLPEFIVDWVEVGLFVVDPEMRVAMWNRFMAHHSGVSADEAIGKNLFDTFPELPRKWLEKKINGVFLLKNFAFTSWEQRPYLFKFRHNRPITGGVDFMHQNCTFMPIKDENGDVQAVAVTLNDVTDTAIYQTMLKDALNSLAESNNRDGLTGIFNRRHLEQRLAAEFDRVKRYGGDLSLIMFDLDHFKRVNDTLGHLAGDEVIRTAASRASEALRSSDIIGRYGGEEFAIILPGTTLQPAALVAERLRSAMSDAPVMHKDTSIPVSISLGVCEVRPDMPNYETLIHDADLALYDAKKSGRNRFVCFDPAVHGDGSR